MSQTHSRKHSLMKSNGRPALHRIIESDSLESFQLQSTSFIENNNKHKCNTSRGTTHHQSREFIGQLMELKCGNDSKNSLLFDCCKY